jgi:hypothetical protein
MRISLDLPEDLHRQLMSIAQDTSRSFNETVVDLIRRGLGQDAAVEMTYNATTGLPLLHVGHTITTEDVRSLEDDW